MYVVCRQFSQFSAAGKFPFEKGLGWLREKNRSEIESAAFDCVWGFFSEIVLFSSNKLVILSQCRLNLVGGRRVRKLD